MVRSIIRFLYSTKLLFCFQCETMFEILYTTEKINNIVISIVQFLKE